MDINNFLKLKNTNQELKKYFNYFTSFWINHQQFIFIILVIASAVLGAYFWCKNIYWSEWSAEQKKSYGVAQNREINLKEEEFKKVLREIERRKQAFKAEYSPVKDIFKPY